MHTLRIIELANYIDRLPDDSFDMSTFSFPNNPCGCIAHHAARLFSPGRFASSTLTMELLDLDRLTSINLCFGVGQSKPLEEITKVEAVTALRRLANGEAPWV